MKILAKILNKVENATYLYRRKGALKGGLTYFITVRISYFFI